MQKNGLVYYEVSGEIPVPNTARELILFKNHSDNEWYTKDINGNLALFAAGLGSVLTLVSANYDASGNTFPTVGSGIGGAIVKGDLYVIGTGGTLGGVAVVAGDVIIATVDNAANLLADWNIIEHDFGYTPENVANKATDFSVLNNTKYPSTQAVANLISGTSGTIPIFGSDGHSLGNSIMTGSSSRIAITNTNILTLVPVGTSTFTEITTDNTVGFQFTSNGGNIRFQKLGGNGPILLYTNTGATRLDISGNPTGNPAIRMVVDAIQIGLDAATATLGFFGAAAVARPSSADQAALTNTNGVAYSGNVVDVTTGGVSDPAKVNSNFTGVVTLLNALRNALAVGQLGLIKGAA